jgi:hypothetical protein
MKKWKRPNKSDFMGRETAVSLPIITVLPYPHFLAILSLVHHPLAIPWVALIPKPRQMITLDGKTQTEKPYDS